jgi:aminopeptidase C
MKRFTTMAMACMYCLALFAQPNNNLEFTSVKELPITPVKNQASSGTCWCFSGLGLIEAELLRMGKGEYDLSEMFVVHHNYADKAEKYVRMHGTSNFAGGGSFDDVLCCIRDYGIVPNEAQVGLNYGDTLHKHAELDQLLKAYTEVIVKNPNKTLSTAWKNGLNGILDAYLGACPTTFKYQGKIYTPKSFAAALDIHPEDYISLTSFTHHPFYTKFAIEIPDNWRWAESYNLPIDELMAVLDNAIDKDYPVAWASDVSEKGFTRQGIATMPKITDQAPAGTDEAKWLKLTQKEREDSLAKIDKTTLPELEITQEMRQTAFDNYETQDDHGMMIFGIAKDQHGKSYYMVKNSWGTGSPYKGIWYVTRPFVEYKTIDIVVHKNAIPSNIKKKLGIK